MTKLEDEILKDELRDELLEVFGKRKQGQIPYGYDSKNGELVENLHEKDIIAKMWLWRERDSLSYQDIADKLNSALEPSKKNTKWHGSVVSAVLLREEILDTFGGHK